MKYCLLKPTEVDQLYEKLKPYLPDVWKTPGAFFSYLGMPTTYCVIVGDFQGAFILSDVVLGSSASVHIYLWDEELRHRYDEVRQVMRHIFMFLDLERLQALPPVGNEGACSLAEKIGFMKEGVLRRAVRYNGELQDLAVYSRLKEE